MKIKIHNKFEIFQGNERYVAYNMLTHNIMSRITNFQPFATYFAFGTGSQSRNYNINKLGSWVLSLSSTLEELQSDPTKNTLYVKRSITIPANERVGLEFSELGITYSSASNPDICNHVNIEDSNGNAVTVVKKAGQELFIRVTIFLELSNDAKKMLTSGPNKLVEALLGEVNSPTFSAVRGYNLSANTVSIYRNVPREGTPVACTVTAEIANDEESATINFAFDLDTGSTAEVVILACGEAAVRYNVVALGTTSNKEETIISQPNRNLVVGDYVGEITSVKDTNNTAVTGYFLKTFAKEFSDFVANPFAGTLNSNSTKWLSEDGNKFAYISGGKLYIYKNQAYNFVQISNNISTENLTNVIMFDNYVFAVYSAVPRLAMFQIENGALVQINVDLTVYTQFDSSYDWRDIKIISSGNGNFTIGVILGQIARKPVIIYATLANGTLTVTNASYGQTGYVVNMFALYNNSFCDSMIGFITDRYNQEPNNYRIEQHYTNRTSEVTNEIPAYYLCNSTVSLEGCSRAVVAKRSTSPYIWLYYYPEVYRYSITLTNGIANWISKDLKYIVQQYNDVELPFRIYNLSDYNNPQEFVGRFPESVNMSSIVDFMFVGDTLLIFSNSGVQALNMKEVFTILENVPAASTNYVVDFTQTKLIGTDNTEGVSGTFTLGVSV